MKNKKVLLALNSFKESIDQLEASKIIANRLKNCNIDIAPLTDGGDGFLSVCNRIFNLKIFKITIPCFFDNKLAIDCEFGYDNKSKTIYIESANAVGLKLIPTNKRNILYYNSSPLGYLIKELLYLKEKRKLVIEKIIVGIGGTAINDLGTGMASVLGLKLYNHKHEMEANPVNFPLIDEIKYNIEIPCEIKVVLDVENPLTGIMGAANIFAAQKGATSKEVEKLEEGFINLLRLLRSDGENLPGAGGGLAAGFKLFLNAKILTASDFIKSELLKDKLGKDFNYVITGEGKLDNQTFLKKAPGIIIDLYKDTSTKIFFICGQNKLNDNYYIPKNVEIIEISRFFDSIDRSIKNTKQGLIIAADIINNTFNS